jgi:hypothetical protein
MSSATLSAAGRSVERPQTVTWAVAILAIGSIVFTGLSFLPLPGQDDIPMAAIIVGSALGVLTLVFCWWLWQCRKWAAIATTIVALLNMLSGLPGLGDPPSGTIAAMILAGIPVALISVWLIWHPASRRAYR